MTAAVLFLVSSAVLPASGAAPKPDKYKQTPEMATISRAAAYLIANSHYNQQQINEQISEQLFDDYFKALDPTRMFFTAGDIKSFEPQKKELGSQIRTGNVQFAFDVFKLFIQRLEEYEKFTAAYLAEKPGLNTDEEFEVNRSKAPWAADRAALEDLWRKKIKNDLILLNLLELAKKEEAKEPAKNKKSDSAKTAPKVKLPPQKSPEERTLKRVEQFVQLYKNLEAVDILEFYLSSLTRIYDPHSEYMSPRTEEDFNIGMKLSLVGIGALLTNEDGYTITKIGEEDRPLNLVYNQDNRTWNAVTNNGQSFELITMNEDGTITFKQADGTPITVSPDLQGMAEARAANGQSLFFAAR